MFPVLSEGREKVGDQQPAQKHSHTLTPKTPLIGNGKGGSSLLATGSDVYPAESPNGTCRQKRFTVLSEKG